MESFTMQQRILVVQTYYESGCSVKNTFCKLRNSFGQHARPLVYNSPDCISFWEDCWCGLWAGDIIGTFFFENNREMVVTVNSERYHGMLTDFLWPKLNELNVNELVLQQDFKTSHTSSQTINLLVTKFGKQIFSRNSDVNWLTRLCDLTPLDYFLWVKKKVKCMLMLHEQFKILNVTFDMKLRLWIHFYCKELSKISTFGCWPVKGAGVDI